MNKLPSFIKDIENVPLQDKYSLLFEQICDELKKSNVSGYKLHLTKTLLENEAKHIRTLAEGLTTSANLGPLETYIYPVLARALPNLIAYELVSVQPLASTHAIVRLLKFRAGVPRGKVNEGELMLPSFASRGVVFSPYYSGPYIDGEPWSRASTTVEVTSSGVVKKAEYPIVSSVILTFTYEGNDFSVIVTGDEKTITIGTGKTIKVQIIGPNAIKISAGEENQTYTLENVRISYETSSEGFPISPEFELYLEKIPIDVEVRKLRVSATLDALLELSAHSISYEADLAEIMSAELRIELDRSVLAALRKGATEAGYVSSWNSTPPQNWTLPISWWFKNLVYEINKASSLIYQRTRRAPGNFVVCSPQIASMLEAAQLLVLSEPTMTSAQAWGVIPLGILQRRWKVYVDPLFPEKEILVGYKGPTIYDSGFVFGPYVPAIPIVQPIRDVMVPEFVFHLGVYTAAGYKMVDPGFYHVIKIV